MKKAYNSVEIELEKCSDVVLTSGEYLETDKTPIGINNDVIYDLKGNSYTLKENNYSLKGSFEL